MMERFCWLVVLVASMFGCARAESQDKADLIWPQFRGATGQGITNDDAPSKWSEEQNIKLKVSLNAIADLSALERESNSRLSRLA
jgi:hypothetical protein